MAKKHVELQSRGLVLRGYFETPEDGAPFPTLVMFHGFGSCMAEKHFVLARLSRALVAAGVATVRFDFGGSGESDGEFIDVTPKTELEDGLAIMGFAAGLPEVDASRLMLMGFSLGGFVAANVAARVPELVERLILMSPGGEPHRRQERMLAELGWCGKGALRLGEGYIRDGYELDPFDEDGSPGKLAGSYEGAVHIIQGLEDAAVPPQTAERYAALYSNAEVTYVEGADHAYDSPEAFQALVRAVARAATMTDGLHAACVRES